MQRESRSGSRFISKKKQNIPPISEIVSGYEGRFCVSYSSTVVAGILAVPGMLQKGVA